MVDVAYKLFQDDLNKKSERLRKAKKEYEEALEDFLRIRDVSHYREKTEVSSEGVK